MKEKRQNLSATDMVKIANAERFKIAVLISEWNENVTARLQTGAKQTLLASGILPQHIVEKKVPGCFELPTATVMMLEADENIDAVICLGCVIQGETRHFEFISQAVATGLMNIGVDYSTPVIFGVLTCDNMEQALARAGGNHGNKGIESAVACLKMLALERDLKK
ncbi:MAG: 6,7-dimethyl-8-ribityllumazine synthase [Bacteroidales bacterium]|jgi:6,7-dimethyl-8-ribityllumazine synthase|nr:6,7-dimethyl-8-ribityllumazine synthase [Bacteroidales bacterium]